MEKRGYLHLDRHRKEHQRLIQELGEIRRKFQAAPGDGVANALAFLVKDWLLGHVIKFDKGYARERSLIDPEPEGAGCR